MSFVAIPAEVFVARFKAAGFSPLLVNNEVVYERAYDKNPHLKIRVYTSLNAHGQCRGKGADAIRACLVYVGPKGARGLGKATRVNRTGAPEAVVERAVGRAREMWKAAAEFIKRPACQCGSPRWGDSGRCVVRCA